MTEIYSDDIYLYTVMFYIFEIVFSSITDLDFRTVDIKGVTLKQSQR